MNELRLPFTRLFIDGNPLRPEQSETSSGEDNDAP
jgi:hypothetical protein